MKTETLAARLRCRRCLAQAIHFEGGLKCLQHPGADLVWVAEGEDFEPPERQRELFG
jgi:hypothetical protein